MRETLHIFAKRPGKALSWQICMTAAKSQLWDARCGIAAPDGTGRCLVAAVTHRTDQLSRLLSYLILAAVYTRVRSHLLSAAKLNSTATDSAVSLSGLQLLSDP